jgi:hypothetical protein
MLFGRAYEGGLPCQHNESMTGEDRRVARFGRTQVGSFGKLGFERRTCLLGDEPEKIGRCCAGKVLHFSFSEKVWE